jgi:hypothetical protein
MLKFYKIKNYYEKKILGLLAITLLFGLVGCEDVQTPKIFLKKCCCNADLIQT